MTIATELKPGDQIVARMPLAGTITLTVVDTYFEPGDEVAPDGSVEVDVTCPPDADLWDMQAFAIAVGAEAAWWLSNTPQRQYRLNYPAKSTAPTA
jgi:hypothetical protein